MSKTNIAQLRTVSNKDGLAEFLQLIERGKYEVFSEVVTFTQPIVDWLIERNPSNRSLNKQSINCISADVSNGLWQFNGETIVISKTGELNDGQHRLYAFAKSGVPVKSLVAFGMPRDSRHTIDMGRAKTPANFLAMNGATNTALTAAVVNLYLLYTKGIYGRTASNGTVIYNTKQDILEEYFGNKEFYDCGIAVSQSSKFCRTLGQSSVATAYLIISEVSPSRVDAFFEHFIEGDGLSKGNPILVLRNKLSQNNERLFSHERIELILRTWNAWRSGKESSRVCTLKREYPKVMR